MTQSHLDNITINITLDSAPVQEQGFSNVMLLVDEALGNALPGGVRFVTYTNLTDAQTDQTGGDITAATLAAVTVAFSQRPQPAAFVVARVDTGGGESYSDALALAILAGAPFYGLCMDTRTPATQVLLSTTVEAQRNMLILQSSDAAWLTTGVPPAYTTLAGRERTAVSFHDTDTEWSDVAWAVKWLVFNPDNQSAPGDLSLAGVAALATAITAAQKGFVKANANVGLPYAGAVFFLDPGQNMNNRPIYEILTADWFETRLEEAASSLKVTLSDRGEKLPVTVDGQTRMLSLIDALFEQGEGAGHFVADQTIARGEAITDADRAAQRLRFSGEAQIAASARLLVFNFNFGLSALAAA